MIQETMEPESESLSGSMFLKIKKIFLLSR